MPHPNCANPSMCDDPDGPHTITEVLDSVNPFRPNYDFDLFGRILGADRDPSRGYGSADEAVQQWLDEQQAEDRLGEADLLQDCLAKVLLHVTSED